MKSQTTVSALQETSVPIVEAQMDRYDITRVPVDYLHQKGLRYTNLEDAVAQAERDELGR